MNTPERRVRLGSALLMVGSLSTIAESGVGPNSALTLGLSVVLIAVTLLHDSRPGRVYSIPAAVLSAIAFLAGLATLAHTWGLVIPYVQAEAGVGPYLSAIGSAVALYGARTTVEAVLVRKGRTKEG